MKSMVPERKCFIDQTLVLGRFTASFSSIFQSQSSLTFKLFVDIFVSFQAKQASFAPTKVRQKLIPFSAMILYSCWLKRGHAWFCKSAYFEQLYSTRHLLDYLLICVDSMICDRPMCDVTKKKKSPVKTRSENKP